MTQTQAAISSAEFTAWLAFYAVEAEIVSGQREEPEPSPDQLGEKIRATFAGLQRRQG